MPRKSLNAKSRRMHPVTPEMLKRNTILGGLDLAQVKAVIDEAELLDLVVRYVIYVPEEPIDYVYFPLASVLSIVTSMKNGDQIEVGTIGREGMSAIPLLFGATTTKNDSYCQVPGLTLRISTSLFMSLLSSRTVRQLVNRYVQAYVNMLGQLAACNRLHNVYERCARWLLMTQDRVDAQEFKLTHEYLAMMLGTQRSGVTIAAGTLQKAGLIRYGRGVITILDREALVEASCECYGVAEAEFVGLLRSVNGGSGALGVSSR